MKLKLLLFTLLLASQLSNGQKAVWVGGALDDYSYDIYGKFIKLSSTQGKPFIGIITAASDTPEEAAKGYMDVMKKIHNFTNVEWIPITLNSKEKAYDKILVEKIS